MSAAPTSIRTLAGVGQFVLEVKKSRFIARAAPLPELEQVQSRIAAFSESEARHNCWAWRCGQSYRFHDADEPGGTAGKPILGAIDGQGLDQVLVVVTRYFGGIKLGAGGLVRAYAHAAAEALRAAPQRPLLNLSRGRLALPFHLQGPVEHALRMLGASVLSCDYRPDGVQMHIEIASSDLHALSSKLADLSAGRLTLKCD